MKIYVVETVTDYLIQIGFSLSKEVAQKKANKLNKKKPYAWHSDYFVTEYKVSNDSDFCEFDYC